MLASFASARELLAWAHEDIFELARLSEAFVTDPANYRQIRTLSVPPGTEELSIRIAEVPSAVRKPATYALWAIKHALDHAMRAAISEITASDPGDVYFLVSSSPNDLRGRLKRSGSKYPTELHDLIESFEIYPKGEAYAGGNDEFCQLAKLAGKTKHALALTAQPKARIRRMGGVGMVGGAKLFPHGPTTIEGDLLVGVFPADHNSSIELELLSIVTIDCTGPVGDVPAHAALHAFAESAMSAIEQLEVEAARVTRQMG